MNIQFMHDEEEASTHIQHNTRHYWKYEVILQV